ncbi:unnamed protein product [Calypogeia fissa]
MEPPSPALQQHLFWDLTSGKGNSELDEGTGNPGLGQQSPGKRFLAHILNGTSPSELASEDSEDKSHAPPSSHPPGDMGDDASLQKKFSTMEMMELDSSNEK